MISIAAVVIAGGALAHSMWSSRREARDRREQFEDERRRHEEQLGVERERRLDERSADLSAVQGSISGGQDADLHTIHLTNGGRSTARDIHLHVAGEDGATLVDHRTRDLPPNTSTETKIAVPRRRGLVLRARWRDGAGERDEQLIELRALR